jgi:nascent polypeptide-associated complex subunit alpha
MSLQKKNNQKILENLENENAENEQKMSRGEKRTRKALENFSYDKQFQFYKVIFQKSINSMFVVFKPTVYKNSRNGSFLIFGEAINERNS